MSRHTRGGAVTRRGRCEMSSSACVTGTRPPRSGPGVLARCAARRWVHRAPAVDPRARARRRRARGEDPRRTRRALRRLANELAVPLSSVLLTAHAKVLGALSGEREVSTGYAAEGRPPLPCRMTTGPHSWREVLLETHRAESELLSHRDFPFDDLRRELGLTKPLFETVFDPTATAAGSSCRD